nr:hypothetical protein RHECNPAF_770083 [Ipomoea batatas]
MPWVWRLIHCVEIQCCFHFRLSSGQEHDSRNSRRHSPFQHSESILSNGLWRSLLFVFSPWGNHARFKQNSFKQNIVFCQIVENLGPHPFCNLKSPLYWVVSIKKNFRFHYWHKTIVLKNSSITSKTPCSFFHSQSRRTARNADNCSPEYKTGPLLVVFS